MMKIKVLGLCVLMLINHAHVFSQAWLGKPIIKKSEKDRVKVAYGPLSLERRTDKDMQSFRDYGLGQFIHWGIYSMVGNEWEGATNTGFSEVVRGWTGENKPKDWTNIYDNLYKQFNPTKYDPKQWAKQAKEMGAKYMIITTKHHDGFCLWPSKYSDYTIAQTPYKKDLLRDLLNAYKAEGIDVWFYFSIIDTYNKDYQSTIAITEEDVKRYENFKTFTRNQVFELLENYPEIKGIWFDGSWDSAWINQYAWAKKLDEDIRKAHPNILIGSRLRNDEFGNRHFDANGDVIGDFEQGWERKLPQKYELLNGNDWDCVMTIPYNGWGYIKDWSKQRYVKTTNDLLKMMMHSISMDGNFVLNFGPSGEGLMSPGEDKVAKEIGDWMKINGEAVYGTNHANDVILSEYGYYSQKDDNLYLTVFNRPVDNLIRVVLPQTAKAVPVSATILGYNKPLEVTHTQVGIDKDVNTYFDIIVPKKFASERAFVIKMKIGAQKSKTEKMTDAKI